MKNTKETVCQKRQLSISSMISSKNRMKRKREERQLCKMSKLKKKRKNKLKINFAKIDWELPRKQKKLQRQLEIHVFYQRVPLSLKN
jgi:hypothetical protein